MHYVVKNWEKHYETCHSRAYKHPTWIAIPSDLTSDGYLAMMEEPDGPAMYGAFLATLLVAQRCKPRGALIKSDGTPHTAATISRKTRVPQSVTQRMLDFLVDVGWVEEVRDGKKDD